MAKRTTQERSESPQISALERFKDMAEKKFKKDYGEDSIALASQEDPNMKWLYVRDLGMQYALGRPGFALGKIATIVGFEGASKSSLGYWFANLALMQGGLAALVETELAGSTKHIGSYVNPDNLIINKPSSLEEGMQMTMDTLKLYNEIDPEGILPKVLIFDSIAGSSLERELEDDREIGDEKVGGKGKLMSKAVEKIKPELKKNNCLWVVCNQARDLIQTGFAATLKIPEIDKIVAAGGRAIPFAASYYMVAKKQGAVAAASADAMKEKRGFGVKVTFKKNKLDVPLKDFYYNVEWGKTLNFIPYTMEFLEIGCGVKKGERGQYYCPDIGIPKASAMPAAELYEIIHSPENLRHFQDLLGIDMSGSPAAEVEPPAAVEQVIEQAQPE